MVRRPLDPRRGPGRRRRPPIDPGVPGDGARGSVTPVSVLWLIPSAVLAIAAVVVVRGAIIAAHEVRELHEAAAEVGVTLEAMSAAVAQTRATLVADGARHGSPPGAPKVP